MSRTYICKDWHRCKVDCGNKRPRDLELFQVDRAKCGKMTELRFLPKKVQLRIVLKSLL